MYLGGKNVPGDTSRGAANSDTSPQIHRRKIYMKSAMYLGENVSGGAAYSDTSPPQEHRRKIYIYKAMLDGDVSGIHQGSMFRKKASDTSRSIVQRDVSEYAAPPRRIFPRYIALFPPTSDVSERCTEYAA